MAPRILGRDRSTWRVAFLWWTKGLALSAPHMHCQWMKWTGKLTQAAVVIVGWNHTGTEEPAWSFWQSGSATPGTKGWPQIVNCGKHQHLCMNISSMDFHMEPVHPFCCRFPLKFLLPPAKIYGSTHCRTRATSWRIHDPQSGSSYILNYIPQ